MQGRGHNVSIPDGEISRISRVGFFPRLGPQNPQRSAGFLAEPMHHLGVWTPSQKWLAPVWRNHRYTAHGGGETPPRLVLDL